MPQIKLLKDLPVDPQYEMKAGTTWMARKNRQYQNRNDVYWWIKHEPTGEKIGVLWHEAVIVDHARRKN